MSDFIEKQTSDSNSNDRQENYPYWLLVPLISSIGAICLDFFGLL
jgi:hypothetical protein